MENTKIIEGYISSKRSLDENDEIEQGEGNIVFHLLYQSKSRNFDFSTFCDDMPSFQGIFKVCKQWKDGRVSFTASNKQTYYIEEPTAYTNYLPY